MSDAEPWRCPTCNVAVATAFCPTCGERRLRARDHTLRGLFDHAIQALTNLDARVIRSVRCLVNRPGALTMLYLQGPRKPYVGPFALFLLSNVLFVAMESLTGNNVFATSLYQHLHEQPWSAFARQLVTHHLVTTKTTLGLYAPVFDRAVADNAKSLVVLMVLPFALLPAILYRRSGQPFVAHVAFSLHFHAFMLLLMSVALLIPAGDVLFGGIGLASRALDNGIGIVLLGLCATYLHVATATVYAATGALRLLKSVVLIVAALTIFLGYRFLLLLITLYRT